MAVRKRARRLRLRRWPTEDWDYTHPGYRVIKTVFHAPIALASRLQVKGRANVPREGGVLLAINHFSWADPLVVGVALQRPAFYLAKERLFRNALFRHFLEAMGQIKVDREAGGNEDALQTAVDALHQGLVVGVFPEGTRSRYGELKRGKTGVARILARADVPVLPIGVATSKFWPKHATLPRFGERVYVNIGAPARFDLKPQDAEDRTRMREVTDDIMGRIRALLVEAEAARDRKERWA